MYLTFEDDKGTPYILGKLIHYSKATHFEKSEELFEALKHWVYKEERNILIKDKEDEDWQKAKKYLEDNSSKEYKKTKVTSSINKVEELDYDEIFSGHWKKQVNNVKEFDNPKLVENLLKYAKNNSTQGVINRIEDYLLELKGSD